MIQEAKQNIPTSKKLIDELLLSKKQLISSKQIMDKKDKHIYPITNSPFRIPKNWQWVYLSDISIIQEGPGIRKHQYTDEGIQFLTVTNILEGSVDLNKSQKYISLNEWMEKYQHFTINKGDILTACSGASWGKSAIYECDERLILNTSTLRLRFFNDLGVNKYLYYLTKAPYFKKNLASHSTGQQPNYGYSHYSKIPIPIPPLAEQKHIVAILDKAFTAIDQAQANIEKNIANAQALFQSKLNAIFTQTGDDWQEMTLGKLSHIMYGYTSKVIEDGNIQYVRITDIQNGKINWETVPFVSIKDAEIAKYKLLKGDIVFARTGATTGKSYLMKSPPNAVFASYLIRVQCNNDILEPSFLYLFFQSGIYWRTVNAGISGSAQGGFNATKLGKMIVHFPTNKDEQLKIVEDINSFKTYIDGIESHYLQKLANLEDLKKSLLQKAFSGKLTQEPSVV